METPRRPLRNVFEPFIKAELERRERLLEYGAELAIRTRAPVTVCDPDPLNPRGLSSVWFFPAGATD